MSERLEAAVNKASKAFDGLVKDIEKIEELDRAAVEKAFNYLSRLLTDARQRAVFSSRIGAFSLEAEPDMEPMSWLEGTPDHPITRTVMVPAGTMTKVVAAGEREVGSKKPVTPPADDIDFIDE